MSKSEISKYELSLRLRRFMDGNLIPEDNVRMSAALGDAICLLVFPEEKQISLKEALKSFDMVQCAQFALWCLRSAVTPSDQKVLALIESLKAWTLNQSAVNQQDLLLGASDLMLVKAASSPELALAGTKAANIVVRIYTPSEEAAKVANLVGKITGVSEKELLIDFLMRAIPHKKNPFGEW